MLRNSRLYRVSLMIKYIYCPIELYNFTLLMSGGTISYRKEREVINK